jgi:SAM-dependent methyltransferase
MNEPRPVMSEFISHSDYAINESQHAGWLQALRFMTFLLSGIALRKKALNIIEFGCGPGTSSSALIDLLYEANRTQTLVLDCVDNDPESIRKMQELALTEERCLVRAFGNNILDFDSEQRYDAFVSVFACSHLTAKEKDELADKFIELAGGGLVLIVDEFLGSFKDEADAYWSHHSTIIFDAIIRGNLALAKLELEALHSGLHAVGDFKESVSDFERRAIASGLSVLRLRCYPLADDVLPSSASTCVWVSHAQEVWRARSADLLHSVLKMSDRRLRPTEASMEVLTLIYNEVHALDGDRALKDAAALPLSRCGVIDIYDPNGDGGHMGGVYLFVLGSSDAIETAKRQLTTCGVQFEPILDPSSHLPPQNRLP